MASSDSTTKDTKSTKELKHEAFQPIFQHDLVEVDQQSSLHSSQLHIGQQLSFVNVFDFLDALDFNDQFVLDENVNSVPTIQSDILISDGLRILQPKCDPDYT